MVARQADSHCRSAGSILLWNVMEDVCRQVSHPVHVVCSLLLHRLCIVLCLRLGACQPVLGHVAHSGMMLLGLQHSTELSLCQ